MPFNGSGTFVSLAPPNFPAVPGTVILASQFNNNMNDIFTSGLTNCMTRDGQSPPSANIPMATFKLTGLGNGTADTDAAALGQVLALRGQVGTVDWNTRIIVGMYEATAASLGGGSSNFPPTADLGMLQVAPQGAIINQYYITANTVYFRQKLSGTWSPWVVSTASGKNYFINSAFQIWQAFTSVGPGFTGKSYTADMSFINSVGTTTAANLNNWPIGQVDVDPAAQFFYRMNSTSVAGAANFCYTEFPVEGVRTLSGRTVTISFWARGATSFPIAVSFEQNFGTGGGPSATVLTFAGKPTITNGVWARYTVTATIPSISGKTIGTTDDFLGIRVWIDAGSNFNAQTNSLGQQSVQLDLWGMKIEDGNYATPYQIPDISQEYSRVFRYYLQSAGFGGVSFGDLTYSGPTTTGTNYIASASLPTIMRKAPTVTLSNQNASGFPAISGSTSSVTPYALAEVRLSNATLVGGSFSSSYVADARY